MIVKGLWGKHITTGFIFKVREVSFGSHVQIDHISKPKNIMCLRCNYPCSSPIVEYKNVILYTEKPE